MIKAVVFDMDGVLVDSEIYYLEVQSRVLSKKYPWITRESLLPMAGISTDAGRTFLAQLMRRDPADPGFQQEVRDMYAACVIPYAQLMRPQVPALLRQLKAQGYTVALASSSGMHRIKDALNQCGITEYFDKLVSGNDFAHSKPDPEIYLYTFRQIGCAPEECLVVEDSTYGIRAGLSAGAHVAALRDDRFNFDQSQAHFLMQSLDEIPAVLQTLNGAEGESAR